jgi:hypothetical protein
MQLGATGPFRDRAKAAPAGTWDGLFHAFSLAGVGQFRENCPIGKSQVIENRGNVLVAHSCAWTLQSPFLSLNTS